MQKKPDYSEGGVVRLNGIKNKLSSQAGASITFALLLFLVCAVLCSVILTAATAASGRMSGIAEADQRYYAVTSAAELLKNVFKKNPTVSIVEMVKTPYSTTYRDGVAGAPVKGEAKKTVYIVADKKASEITDEDLVDGNKVGGVSPIDSIQKDAAKNIYDGTTSNINKRELTVTSSFFSKPEIGLDYDAIAVTILEDLDADGNIILTMYNKYKEKDIPSNPGSRYTLVMQLGADKGFTTSTKTENVSSTAVSGNSYKVNTETTEISITTLTWTLIGIKTGS